MTRGLTRSVLLLIVCAALTGCPDPMEGPCPGGCLLGEICGDDGTCIPEPEDPDGGPPIDNCVDGDGDHHGEECPAGPDCDDTDPTQHSEEVCDGADNDCDTTIDEDIDVDPVCGCDPLCEREQFGVGGLPFDLDTDPNEGVIIDDTGAIRVQRRDAREPHHLIWISNTGEGTILKVDTRTFEEIGRYRTGPLGSGNDPSRTSVDSRGDCYVGNRGGTSVTKISAAGSECPDTNGDGVITTSTGPGDILEWGQDDCVLWHTPISGGYVRAVAAQEQMGPDGEIYSNVWIGGWDSQRVYKMDGNTGEILLDHPSPTYTYGFALDALGNLWISPGGNQMGRVDTTDCDVDHCTTEVIAVPGSTYGITVDMRQRVWLGGTPVTRYDPSAAPGDRFVTSTSPAFVHGIGADARGNVWGAAVDSGIIRFDAEDPTIFAAVPATVGGQAKGIGIDDDGKVWAVNWAYDATVVVPREAIDEFTVWMNIVPGLTSPYTYSDMTGQQLRLATSALGRYSTVIDTCPPLEGQNVEYRELRWDADVPDGTRIVWRGRTAETREELSAAGFIDIGSVPTATSPIDIAEWLVDQGLTGAQFFEVQVLMYPTVLGAAFVSPIVRGFELVYACPDLPE